MGCYRECRSLGNLMRTAKHFSAKHICQADTTIIASWPWLCWLLAALIAQGTWFGQWSILSTEYLSQAATTIFTSWPGCVERICCLEEYGCCVWNAEQTSGLVRVRLACGKPLSWSFDTVEPEEATKFGGCLKCFKPSVPPTD
jgi:hypothetical protein